MVEKIGYYAMAGAVIIGIIAILIIAAKGLGIDVPPWIILIGWVCIGVGMVCLAIRFLIYIFRSVP